MIRGGSAEGCVAAELQSAAFRLNVSTLEATVESEVLSMMTAGGRVAWAWATAWAIALGVVYFWSYFQPDENGLTRFVTRWSNRRFGRWQVVGRTQTLLLGILFACLAIVGAIVTVLGLQF